MQFINRLVRSYQNNKIQLKFSPAWLIENTACFSPAICRTGCHPIGGNCSAPFQCECNEGWRGDLCDECIPAAGCCELSILPNTVVLYDIGVSSKYIGDMATVFSAPLLFL